MNYVEPPCRRCGAKVWDDGYCENGHARPVVDKQRQKEYDGKGRFPKEDEDRYGGWPTRPLNPNDFPLGGEIDINDPNDDPYKDYCKDEPQP